MKPPLESEILKQCLQYLRLRGIVCWRVNSGAVAGEHKGKRRFVRFNTMPGCSDILGLLPPSGRLLAIECKRPGGKATPDQLQFLDLINRSGGLAFIATSVGDISAALAAEGVM